MEDEEETDGGDELCKEDEILPEISTDGRYRRYSTERALAISPDDEIEDYDVSSESSEEDLVTPTLHSRVDLSFDPSEQGKNCPSHSPPPSNHKRANGDGTFSCAECEKNFTVRAKLIKHQRTHSAEKPFSCSECSKSFRQKCLLRRHQTRHNSDQAVLMLRMREKFRPKIRYRPTSKNSHGREAIFMF
ncbi:zinc finger protein 41 homolog [Rana temporaria]|uniref:zinc finger protein 41 homolog n=1 Tax=Rana temporaria TaxID=8407 RepID=UPI001AAC6488|nr:zinc finger protein 41 homolog [Rana temporaria]